MGGVDSTTTIPCPLRSAALASPGAPAIIGAGRTVTYGELDRRVTLAASEIRNLGLGEGARAALYLPKSADYIVLLHALARAGCVASPLSTRLPPRRVAPLLEKAGCRAVISDEGPLDDPEIVRLSPEILLDEPEEHDPSVVPARLALQQPATAVFTSGSMGEPKAALHTLGNHYWSARGSNANIPLGPGDRWLHSLPLYHVGGLSILFRCLLSGAAVALPEPEATLGENIARSGATHVSLVPTQLLRLLREESFDAARLKAILLGGGPMPVPLLEEASGAGLPVHASYGLTEMASQVTTTRPGASAEELRTSGRALPHREVSVSGSGEILVRGETLFAGYLDGDAVVRPFDEHGWFHTKDLGELDFDGRLRVKGRMDNLFISGGENVQPEEAEEALCRLEGVEEAVVVPVPDAEFGHRPAAFVRTDGRPVEPEELARTLGSTLPRFKIPISFYEWPEGDEGMKVDRAAFRERARRLHLGKRG
ncbi:MAG TPA: o-succinylbenzoate--CoA ligase [Rubrobacteraceae bacterium]|nr:o-succinylbenzoate--CoA ligase [Rubrobacteraceae bacterium]